MLRMMMVVVMVVGFWRQTTWMHMTREVTVRRMHDDWECVSSRKKPRGRERKMKMTVFLCCTERETEEKEWKRSS